MQKYKSDFIEFMVKSGVLMFGEFKTKAGRLSPYFLNSGNYTTGEQLHRLGGFYADCIHNSVKAPFDALFGPAYKGIPISVTTAGALYSKYNINAGYLFNRKEAKDHGEGGILVGYRPKDGDRIVITEDVTSAGTSIRDTMPILKAAADVTADTLIISVDRREKGQNGVTAVQELKEEFGITTYPIVTVHEIIEHLYGREIDGKVYLDGEMKAKMEAYLEKYS